MVDYDIETDFWTYYVHISRNFKISTKLGVFDSCLGFLFDDWRGRDEEEFYTFAPQIGIVKKGNGMGIFFELESACINDKIISAVNFAPQIPHMHVYNYPNPFNSSTIFSYVLKRPGDVTLTIYDSRGKYVIRLFQTEHRAGRQQMTWNATTQSSGVYFYILNTPEYTYRGKMLLLK